MRGHHCPLRLPKHGVLGAGHSRNGPFSERAILGTGHSRNGPRGRATSIQAARLEWMSESSPRFLYARAGALRWILPASRSARSGDFEAFLARMFHEEALYNHYYY